MMGIRAIITGVFCLLTFVNASTFDSGLVSRELGIADIPPCGISCLVLTIPPTGCTITDTTCVCEKAADIVRPFQACMLANCTMADTLLTSKVQADTCHLSGKSRRTEMFWYSGVVYFVAILVVALRLIEKLVSHRVSWDDYIVVSALIMAVVPLVAVFSMTRLGFGHHVWNLEDGVLLPILRYFWIAQSSYVLVLGLIKVSLILFYLEIFKTRNFRLSAFIIMAYIIVNSLIIFFMSIFICSPVESFWNRDLKGKCMNVEALAYANSASAIVQDVMMIILPLVFIRNLQMKSYRKLAVAFMFTVGTFGCIVTIIRLHSLLGFRMSTDPTWDYVAPAIWTELELVTSFVCVSLPSIRVMLSRVLPARVKGLMANISQAATKSHPIRTQQLPSHSHSQNDWCESAAWTNTTISAGKSKPESKPGSNFLSRLLSKDYWSPLPSRSASQSVHGTRSPGSAADSYMKSDAAETQVRDLESRNIEDKHGPVELLQVMKTSEKLASMDSPRSSNGDQLAGLLSIGCLPERTFSILDPIGSQKQGGRKDNIDDNV